MAISSPLLPSLSPLSALFSQVIRRTTKIEPKASLHPRFPSNPQPKIKHQNHLRKKLSNTKFSGDFSANQPSESDVKVPVDDSSDNNLVISSEIDSFGMVSKERRQLEGFVGEEEGIDPLGAPAFGLEVKKEGEPACRTVPRNETSPTTEGATFLNEEQKKINQQQHNSYNSSTNKDKESKISFSKSTNLNGNGEITGEEPWWYRLPCVLGILLFGGESDSAPGGLYSLEIEHNSSNSNPTSYAITFEGRADATNFCYVLDSFFEDLNDVSAEVIPLMIQEIKEEVESGRLNLMVIPKGKLKLYAGQPLEEVEIALRSFVD